MWTLASATAEAAQMDRNLAGCDHARAFGCQLHMLGAAQPLRLSLAAWGSMMCATDRPVLGNTGEEERTSFVMIVWTSLHNRPLPDSSQQQLQSAAGCI